MQQYVNRLLFLVLIWLPAQETIAQSIEDPTISRLDSCFGQYVAGLEQPDLFLHLDKTVYVTQENIWFTAYLLNEAIKEAQHTLHVLLVEEATQKICASERFVANNGLSYGSLFLADSLAAGEYRLLAYTNSYLIHPSQPVYQQSVSIRKNETIAFKLAMLPLTPQDLNKDTIRLTYKVLTGYSGLASGGNMVYKLLADGKKLQDGKQKINAFGEVNFSMLRQDVLYKKLRLQATVTRLKDTQYIKTEIPLFEQTAFLKCYPEGGNLVEGHPNAMAVEIRNGMGVPIATRGKLLSEGRELAAFETDQYGIGIIHWMPYLNKSFSITIDHTGLSLAYQLPAIAATGYSIKVPNGVVEDSSVYVQLRAPDSGTCYVVMHNYRKSFFAGRLFIPKKEASLRLSANGLPDGVTTITLFDAAGIPQVERAIYVHRQKDIKVQMITDSTLYQHRSKLQLKIKVTNSIDTPVQALFSLACVLASRIDSTRAGDIARYYYFDRFLPQQTSMPPPQYFTNQQQVERILLTRYWTRYKWEEISTAKPWIPVADKPCHVGYVYLKDKKVKKPVQLMLLAEKTFMLSTDSTGYFTLPSEALRIVDGKKAILLIADKDNFKDYKVSLINRCGATDTLLAATDWPEAGTRKAELSIQEQQYLKNAMQAVVVTAKKNAWESGVFKSTTCNDWVCMFNILNCPNHPVGSIPQDGQEYTYQGRRVVYRGCKGANDAPQFMQQLKGVNYPKEFYVADYEKFNPTQPETMSTVYWNYTAVTDKKGEAVLTFSTNDLNGRFTCVLQGYSTQGVVSGKTTFTVK